MRILITGARGFIGSTIAQVAVERGWDVCGVGRSSQAPQGWQGAYQWADVAQSDMRPLIEGFKPDVIFHGAGSASVGNSFDAPYDDLRASVMTFASVLDSVRRAEHRPKILFPSSAAVYGNPARLPIVETDLAKPISPYGFHKWQCELLAQEFASCFDLEIVICRIFSVFGPMQRRLLAWELFEQMMGDTPEVRLKGTGEESRDYLHSSDAARAMLNLAAIESTSPLSIFNIASGVEITVLELSQTMAKLLNCEKPILLSGNARVGDPTRWLADNTMLKTAAPNWIASPLQEALVNTLRIWMKAKSNPEQY